ncbi:MAG TPA: RidA family protein [Terriglobia bacterium]|nr:RidA family protein [Terriglobia bacterium]
MTICESLRRLAVGSALGLMMVAVGPPPCLAQAKRAVNLAAAHAPLPFSDGIRVGNTLYVAGQQGTGSTGKLEEGISGQTRAALETIRRVVTKEGFRMSDVVAVNVYLSDIHDFAAMNKVYTTFFPDPKPTRTTVQVAALVNGAKIEISAIAAKP